MAVREPRFVFVTSTAGSVMNELLANRFLKGLVHSVVADRRCDGLAKAAHHGVPIHLIEDGAPATFCAQLADYMDTNSIDYVLSFYTQFYSKDFRDRFRDRIVNSHPSLLPSFKGLAGFEDGVAYHCKMIGSTVELIRDVMDEGAIVMQTACPVDWTRDLAFTRHRVFVQQCKAMLQTVKWIADDRIRIKRDQVLVSDATYSGAEFAPDLDFDQAIHWQIPMPTHWSARPA